MLRQLQELGAAKSAIMTDDDLTEDEKAEKVKRPVYFFVKTIIFTKKYTLLAPLKLFLTVGRYECIYVCL